MARPQIAKLHPSLGAEVVGVDLGQPVDEPTRQMLSRALADHLALVFHDQTLTPPAQYLAAASLFGPPMEQHYSQHNMPDFSMIGGRLYLARASGDNRPASGRRDQERAKSRNRWR
jgi:alpha-ketoglutarate-dependent taurine dioxygenase